MNYWLMKTEPQTFGLEHLLAAPRRTTMWDGVRNYQARNMLRDQVRRGDRAFLYHSSCDEPGIVALLEVVKEAYPDPTAFDARHRYYDDASDPASPRWYAIDVKLEKALKKPVFLQALREHEHGALAGMQLLKRGNRLSITPVDVAHWRFIIALANARDRTRATITSRA